MSNDGTMGASPASVALQTARMPNRLMRWFVYAHLPAHLQSASKPFADLAENLDATYPESAEKTAALRKLLEAKDCMVRAHIEALENQRAAEASR